MEVEFVAGGAGTTSDGRAVTVHASVEGTFQLKIFVSMRQAITSFEEGNRIEIFRDGLR
jgi:hypothetical protein